MTPAAKSISFHVSSGDLQNGSVLEHLAESNMRTFCGAIGDVAMALLTTGNYGTPEVVTPEASFGLSNVATLANAIRSPRRCLIASTSAYANLAEHLKWNGSEWSLPGWSGVFEISDWASAGSNIYAAAVDPSALVVVAGPPQLPRVAKLELRTVNANGLDLPVTASFWCDPRLRTGWGSYDLTIGSAIGQAGSCRLVASE